jgi:hypothetical protein
VKQKSGLLSNGGRGKEVMKEDTITYSVTSYPYHMLIKISHILFSHWVVAHSSDPPISNIKLTCHLLSAHYTFTLKMAISMFTKTLVNIQHSMWFTPEN